MILDEKDGFILKVLDTYEFEIGDEVSSKNKIYKIMSIYNERLYLNTTQNHYTLEVLDENGELKTLDTGYVLPLKMRMPNADL
jgi:hypothetical protein